MVNGMSFDAGNYPGGVCGDFGGIFRKGACSMWFFDGENVVKCVANVVR